MLSSATYFQTASAMLSSDGVGSSFMSMEEKRHQVWKACIPNCSKQNYYQYSLVC